MIVASSAAIGTKTIAGIRWEPEPDYDPDEMGNDSGFLDLLAFTVIMAIVLMAFGKLK